ncbi:MAG TPA: GNAT family N-acetyltransferase [Jatrophihabitans sp.]|jgi:predicted N-acetyltransferase YhbS
MIRTAGPGDRAALRALAERCWDLEPLDRPGLVDLLLDRPGQRPDLVLVADDGAGLLIADAHEGTGYLDAIAVDPARRRRGIGRALIAEVERRLATFATTRLSIGGHPWYYAWPGIDERYTAALRLAEHAGYAAARVIENMTVTLAGRGPAPAVPPGWTVRRAMRGDAEALDAFVRALFPEPWPREAARALARPAPSAFVAYHGSKLAGFACHNVYRTGWFGPIGTAEAARGQGIGAVLLGHCLDDLAAAGLPTVEIVWIGPADFYARTVDARPGRRFVHLTKELA